ncbi:hypothetical protein MKW98_000422 [Papaver atlanticum]|uniref:HVA22-like protein n=1 Tax=Papaver atlanticum TaxID=357466 RepID=A0AAD4S5Q6_9MAGN|nr:hypothetical protein MKW98_000422 [Papaver atlanticum]
MIGSFLTRGLVMVFGYAYPAYECFKTVEKNKPEIEQLRFWCQYWILVAMLTVFERVGDTFVSWVPMYSEAKLAFFIYLWYPKTMGTTYVYDSFFRPYIAKHEPEIDRNLLELKTRAGDMAILYWQRAATYGQTRVFGILQYIASQSTSRPRPSQQQQGVAAPPTAQPPSRTSSTGTTQQPTRTASTGTTEEQQETAQETVVSHPKPPAPSVTAAVVAAAVSAQTTVAALLASETSLPSSISKPSNIEAETSKKEPVPAAANENANQPQQDTVMNEAIRMTRGRLRKTRSGDR